MIKIENLHYKYPDKTKALKGIDLHIKKDELATLIGHNGAGKSTILMHLNGLLVPEEGKVIVDSLEVNQKNITEIRKKVGIVFQNPDDMLFSPTVYDDVSFGPKNMGLSESEIKKRVDVSLKIVDMSGFEDKNPHHLSLGQKKRVAIAAILSMQPEVIIFDEPTSHLDPKGKKEIIRLIESLQATKIIATHDMSLLEKSDSVHIINDGKIAYSGDTPKKNILEKFDLL